MEYQCARFGMSPEKNSASAARHPILHADVISRTSTERGASYEYGEAGFWSDVQLINQNRRC